MIDLTPYLNILCYNVSQPTNKRALSVGQRELLCCAFLRKSNYHRLLAYNIVRPTIDSPS